MPLLQLRALTVAFGDQPVLDSVDLVLERGERLCLIGRNGAGKSTLLKVISGDLEQDDGEMIRQTGLRTSYLPQYVPSQLEGRVLDLVGSGLVRHEGERAERLARAAISRVGLEADADVATLSAGLKRRALLARALAPDPDVLLLDEPTNHLDVESITWMEELLRREGQTLLFVTHDRAFLRRLATGILDLDRGKLTRWDADYDRYRDRKDADFAAERRGSALFDKRLAEEEVWIRQGVRERRKRNQGRVRRLEEMRGERGVRREVAGTVKMEAQAAERSGRRVAQARHVDFAWEGKTILKDFSIEIQRGERVGIVGPNGSGKTTMINVLLGTLEPDAGSIRLGTNLEIGYFDQLHAQLDETASAADAVTGGRPTVTVNGKTRQAIGYLRDFLFSPDQARMPVSLLSGGERNRLLLARLFASPSNLLVLDEPTNDLDIETLEVLEDLLADYAGTVLVVSHDRELLDRVVTSTLVFEGDGRIGEYVGGWSDQLRQRAAKARPPAASGKKQGARPGRPKKTSPLSRDEKKELNDLPGRIEALESERAALHDRMAEPAFFKQEGSAIAKAQTDLARMEEALKEAYERWEALEAKKDA